MVKVVRAKLRVDSIEGNIIKMSTVYEDPALDTENAKFTKATPWGQLAFGVDNPVALEMFEVGKSYYADFTSAEKPSLD